MSTLIIMVQSLSHVSSTIYNINILIVITSSFEILARLTRIISYTIVFKFYNYLSNSISYKFYNDISLSIECVWWWCASSF
jgi:hypothetical protein